MKLVEILARELHEWPDGQLWASQDPDKEVRFGSASSHDFYASQRADDAGLVFGCGARVTRGMWEAERARLQSVPEWDGQGLPPSGTDIEYLGHLEKWKKGRYLGEFEGRSVCGDYETGAVGYVDGIRPLRTPEQVAAEKREREINELVETIICHYEYPKGAESYIGLARALHNAGYRKQEKDQ